MPLPNPNNLKKNSFIKHAGILKGGLYYMMKGMPIKRVGKTPFTLVSYSILPTNGNKM